MTKLLVMTEEQLQAFCAEFDDLAADELRAAMTEIDLDDIPVVAHGPILHRIEAHGIKEG